MPSSFRYIPAIFMLIVLSLLVISCSDDAASDHQYAEQWQALCENTINVSLSSNSDTEAGTNSHDLSNQLYSVEQGVMIDCTQLLERLSSYSIILLGEQHGNEHHNAIETMVLDSLLVKQRDQAEMSIQLAMEMFSLDQQAVIDREVQKPEPNANAIVKQVNWWESSWPAFTHYEALVQKALDNEVTIKATDLAMATQKVLKQDGLAAMPEALRRELKLNTKPLARIEQSWWRSMHFAQCERLTKATVDNIAKLQYVRDTVMAQALLPVTPESVDELATATQTVKLLVAGNEHIRHDRSLPYQLQRLGFDGDVVSIALIEAIPTQMDWQRYLPQDAWGKSYDYVWFTAPRGEESSCAKLDRILGPINQS